MSDPSFGLVMVASLFSGIVTGLGIYAIRHYETWADRNSVYFMSFAAGVLISVAMLHLLPESAQLSGNAPAFWLAGFWGLYLSGYLLRHYLPEEYRDRSGRFAALISILGIGLHSFVDGIIYAVTFNVSFFTGMLALVGMILHEFPEGIVAFALHQEMGYSSAKAVRYALLTTALSTPLGTLLAYPFVRQLTDQHLGSLLGVTAGVLIYVGGTHLLPLVEERERPYRIWLVVAGVAVAVSIVFTRG